MSRIIMLCILMISTVVTAKSEVAKVESCSLGILDNGVGYLPWRYAQPFPWSNIQGTWQVAGSKKPLYFVFKITKDDTTRKIIDTRVYEDGSACNAPIAKGMAYIYANAKNTVRAQIADKDYKYLLKLAMFNTTDLNIENADCGESVLGASKQVIGATKSNSSGFDTYLRPNEVDNFLLKKVSSLLEYSCQN